MRDHAGSSGDATPSNDLLTRHETAELTGLTVFTLDQYRMLRKHGLERGPDFVKRGHYIFYPRRAVEAWLAKREG